MLIMLNVVPTGSSGLMIKWQCLLVTDMGYQLVQDDFPVKFNRDDVTRAFEGRYGTKAIQVNPSSVS